MLDRIGSFGFLEGIVAVGLMSMRCVVRICALGLVLSLTACAGDGGSGGDPGARPLPAGMSCQTVRTELNKMDSQGAQAKVERASRGGADPATKAVADRYNQLLNLYLGARCHT